MALRVVRRRAAVSSTVRRRGTAAATPGATLAKPEIPSYISITMPPSAARKISPVRAPSGRARPVGDDPIVVYAGHSLDGTSFALDPVSQERVREAFPGVRVSTRHIFIAHDTRENFEQSIGRFEDQIAMLLTGVSADRLGEQFPFVSFRDPRSRREMGRLRVRAERTER